VGAFGVSGAGRGGGGVDERGFGMAAVGTQGRGGGGRGGEGYGKGAANLGERKALNPTVVPKPPQVMGSLSREQIERVVRQHRNEIKFCYEQELQKNPKLAGTIKIKFTISGTGSVMSALVAETSMKNAGVERCMTGKIQRWAFPEPKGGGIVIVNYPFNFSA
jgi:outer membrane biosynthesis protein TonB